MSEETAFAYDKVLYPNYLHTQTHPDRLATMTRFFGVNPQSVENCRVLELGCGTGSSLLSFAYDLQGSEFVGIDLSEKQIELGQMAVNAIGLKNLTLQQGDIMKITRESFGEFDYIIAHGVYSWVPDFVREGLMKLCSELLTPHGVAFISYNAQPGCHFRQMAREMMMFHTRNISVPQEKIEQSLGFFKFIADSVSPEKKHYEILQHELKDLTSRNYQNIFHDDLSDFNHPVYFHEFVAHSEKHGLQFVTEVEHFTTKDVNYSKEVLEVLEGISNTKVELEQYLDFINCRRFRQTLLCRSELNLTAQPNPETLRDIRIASPMQPTSEKPELASNKHEIFVAEKDQKIEIDHPITKAAFYHLGKIWARSVTFNELMAESRKLLSAETGIDFEISARDEEVLIEVLFRVFSSGMLRFHVHEPTYTTVVSEKPEASPIARWQNQHSDSVSTLLSTSVIFQDPLSKRLLDLLDGTRNHQQLAEEITAFINTDGFDQPAEIKQNILRGLPEQLENTLQNYANMALLIA